MHVLALSEIVINLKQIFCKGRTIRKVMGGWGKNQKKIHASVNAKKKKFVQRRR